MAEVHTIIDFVELLIWIRSYAGNLARAGLGMRLEIVSQRSAPCETGGRDGRTNTGLPSGAGDASDPP